MRSVIKNQCYVISCLGSPLAFFLRSLERRTLDIIPKKRFSSPTSNLPLFCRALYVRLTYAKEFLLSIGRLAGWKERRVVVTLAKGRVLRNRSLST